MSFAQRPAGDLRDAIAHVVDHAHDRVDELLAELDDARIDAATLEGGLVALDIRRARTALGAANVALERAHRHTGLL